MVHVNIFFIKAIRQRLCTGYAYGFIPAKGSASGRRVVTVLMGGGDAVVAVVEIWMVEAGGKLSATVEQLRSSAGVVTVVVVGESGGLFTSTVTFIRLVLLPSPVAASVLGILLLLWFHSWGGGGVYFVPECDWYIVGERPFDRRNSDASDGRSVEDDVTGACMGQGGKKSICDYINSRLARELRSPRRQRGELAGARASAAVVLVAVASVASASVVSVVSATSASASAVPSSAVVATGVSGLAALAPAVVTMALAALAPAVVTMALAALAPAGVTMALADLAPPGVTMALPVVVGTVEVVGRTEGITGAAVSIKNKE
ncbi:hypothetical protein BYT27DRAFT_7206995 [Phlegmacium glaucopus]|nr:hypothetical protein BYT27DRAFT_7206995 [Phlegmacium glaucopus]